MGTFSAFFGSSTFSPPSPGNDNFFTDSGRLLLPIRSISLTWGVSELGGTPPALLILSTPIVFSSLFRQIKRRYSEDNGARFTIINFTAAIAERSAAQY
jgi:hypothetical protein